MQSEEEKEVEDSQAEKTCTSKAFSAQDRLRLREKRDIRVGGKEAAHACHG